jgi:hypothetical protein
MPHYWTGQRMWQDAGMDRRHAEILGVPVDLAPVKTLKEDVRERAAHKAMLAF